MSLEIDDIAPNFLRAKNRWHDAPNLNAHYSDLKNTYATNGSSLIELSKSFLESVCITILSEFGEVTLDEGTTYYLVQALEVLGFKNTRGTNTFDKVLSGYNKLSDALSAIRNADCRVAHGKNAYIDHISLSSSRAFLLTTDTILAFLLEVEAREGVSPELMFTREPHSKFKYYNTKIDSFTRLEAEINEEGDVEVHFKVKDLDEFSLCLSASEILFYQDRQAYIDTLELVKNDKVPQLAAIGAEENNVEVIVPVPVVLESATSRETPIVPLEYVGTYSSLFDKLNEQIGSILRAKSIEDAKIVNFLSSVLQKLEEHVVVDWKKRDMILASIKLMIKHRAEHHLEETLDSELISHILDWLINNTESTID